MNEQRKTKDHSSPFGLVTLPGSEKTKRVQSVFSSVANRYDLMNDLMSGGMHRWWKLYTLSLIHYQHARSITDLACGSGDLMLGHAKRMPPDCQLIGIDPNPDMLAQAKTRLADRGIVNARLCIASAESLPLESNSQCLVSCSFGLRNTTNMHQALSECHRVLRPSGRMVILEFSKPATVPLQKLYAQYSRAIPWLGKWIAKDRASYQYLIDSIASHPDQPTLAKYIQDAGFALADWVNLSGGIVAVHSAYKT